ncbi:hypothetical protein HPB50_020139 [Hyalomma asiaticum]|uniref:Uncharacterized protein n=1 Tax=Hyalomma asiaticum TaxID=266040 RepID=A0ACB7TAQ5_HYAAI|nr:hypothetical protein HPB50_020139 [Hyalomma asiaticum]
MAQPPSADATVAPTEPAMVHKVRIGTEELDADEINERFPGLNLTTPCTVERDGHDDGGSVRVSTCHILDGLSRWNYFLWHVGLQLREIRAPGKLSLVRVAYRGKGGCRQRARSEDARFLFHVLLVQHKCVDSVHLEDTLIEGCGLGEFRERIVAALRKNTSLRTLTIGSLFSEYRLHAPNHAAKFANFLFAGAFERICSELIATMSNLRELSVLVYEAAPSVLLDTICQLLTDTTCLITLSMPRLVLNEVISLNDVLLHDLKQVCRAVKKRAIRGRVRVEDIYVVDSVALSELQEFPEALRRVSIRSFAERSLEKLRGAVHLACSWYQVNTLSLCLRQNVVHDSSTCRTLCKYLSTADSLRELELSGSAHSLLLAAILKNKSVRVLRLSELRLGEANLRFLVGEVVGSRTLCEFTFASLDPVENDTFVRSLATGFQENKTITRLCVWDTTDSVDEEWFTVEDVIGRNIGHLTCAAHSVVRQTHSPRCAAAFKIVSHTPALQKKVEELQNEVGTV